MTTMEEPPEEEEGTPLEDAPEIEEGDDSVNAPEGLGGAPTEEDIEDVEDHGDDDD
jgi:hypothetical protein